MSLIIRPHTLTSQPQFVQALTVRRATPADAVALQRIYNQPSVLENTGQDPLTTVDQVEAWLTTLRPQDHLLVAYGDGDVLGALLLQPMPHLALRHTGQIQRVAVDQERRGRGVGAQLLTAALELADKWLNLYRVELLVRADNPAAVNLYRRYGFQEEGLLRGYGYRNGAYMDCLAMARLRGPLASGPGLG